MDTYTEKIHPRTMYYGTVSDVWHANHRRGAMRGLYADTSVVVEEVMDAGGQGVIEPVARLSSPSAFKGLTLQRGDVIRFLATRKEVMVHDKTYNSWLRIASVTVIDPAQPVSSLPTGHQACPTA
jgi:hypothetical protein